MTFLDLWAAAKAAPEKDAFVAAALAELQPSKKELPEFTEQITRLWNTANAGWRELIFASGFTSVRKWAIYHDIPYRTASCWVTGERETSDWMRLLIAERDGYLTLRELIDYRN